MKKPLQLFRTYPHNRLKRDGAKLVYYRPEPAFPGRPVPAPYWVMLLHEPSNNGDGGVVWTFSRKRRRWVADGLGRLRYAHEPARTVFAELLQTITPQVVAATKEIR